MTYINSELLKAAAIYLIITIALTITTVPLMNVVLGWYANNWTPCIYVAGSFGLTYTLAFAIYALNNEITLLEAMAEIASLLMPWGWAIINSWYFYNGNL